MRLYTRTLVPATALMVVLTILPSPMHAAKEPKTVKINITCRGGDSPAKATVKPELVKVDQDQNITWKLHINNSNKNDLTIEPKTEGHWPYEATKHIGKNGEAKTIKMKPTAEGDYDYRIRYKCDETDYLIDPRVRVGGGGG